MGGKAPAAQAFRVHQVAAQSLRLQRLPCWWRRAGVTAEPSWVGESFCISLHIFPHHRPTRLQFASPPVGRYKAGAPESPRVVSHNPLLYPYWWGEGRMGWISSPEFRAVWLGQWEEKTRGDQVTTTSSSFPPSPPSPRCPGWGERYGVTNKELPLTPGGRWGRQDRCCRGRELGSGRIHH